jgi:fermentation-respiration switch protein FrsA (DUF1100 family)
MGAGNADRRGGLGRPEAAKMNVTTLPADLEKLAALGHPDDPRTSAMLAAADVLRLFLSCRSRKNPLNDPLLQAVGYTTELHQESQTMRLAFYRSRGHKEPIAYMILETPEVYELASVLLSDYDKLEGIGS